MTARQTAVQKGGDGVDADRPRDGEVDEGLDPFGILDPFILGLQDHPAAEDVEEQIAVQDDHIPEQHGVGGGMEQNVHGPHGLAQVGDDEHQAHGDGRNGHEFAKDDDAAEGLVVMEIIRQHQHQAAGGHPDQKGELGDIHPPGHIPAHAGDTQAVVELLDIAETAHTHYGEQEEHPDPVPRASF